jgi:hypothetical protein
VSHTPSKERRELFPGLEPTWTRSDRLSSLQRYRGYGREPTVLHSLDGHTPLKRERGVKKNGSHEAAFTSAFDHYSTFTAHSPVLYCSVHLQLTYDQHDHTSLFKNESMTTQKYFMDFFHPGSVQMAVSYLCTIPRLQQHDLFARSGKARG